MDTKQIIHHHLTTKNAFILAVSVGVLSLGPSSTVQAALLGTYDFEGTSAVAAGANSGVNWGNFQRTTVTEFTSSYFFASADWSTTATYDPNRYVSFTLQSKPGNYLSLTDITFYGSITDSGPQVYNAAVIVGGFSETSINFIPSGGSKRTFDFTDISPTSQQIEFRFYGWSAADAGGALGFDNVVINGAVTAVPEPVNIALAGFGLVTACVGIGRRFSRRCDRTTETTKH